jgi:hypothetical protein
LIGCVKNNYDSFAEVYERGTVTQQLEYAVKNELLEDIGFNSVEYNGGSVGWEISDFEKEVSVVYHINHEKELVGTIKREIDDNELKRVCQVKCVNFFVNFWWSVKPDHLFLT